MKTSIKLSVLAVISILIFIVNFGNVYADEIWKLDPFNHSLYYIGGGNTAYNSNYYGNSNNEVCFYFTVTQPTAVIFSNSGSELEHTSLILQQLRDLASVDQNWEISANDASAIQSEHELVERIKSQLKTKGIISDELDRDLAEILDGQAFICAEIPPGDYLLISEGADIGRPNNGNILTNMYVYQLGNTIEEAIDLGEFNSFFNSDNWSHSPFRGINTVFYKFTLKYPLPLSIKSNGVKDGTYIRLYDKYKQEIAYSIAHSGGEFSGISKTLPADTYYIEYGEFYTSCLELKGMGITFPINRPGDTYANPVDLGIVSDSKSITLSHITGSYSDQYRINPQKDVYLKFMSEENLTLNISKINPNLGKGAVYTLLDESGNMLRSETIPTVPKSEKSGVLSASLKAGVYYIVIEGYKEDNLIETSVEFKLYVPEYESETLSPDKKRNYILSVTCKKGMDTESALEMIASGDSSFISNTRRKIDYLDGLGRPSMSMVHKGSPAGKDLILSFKQYDEYGRCANVLNQFPGTGQSGRSYSFDEAMLLSEIFYNDSSPNEEILYMDDALARVSGRYGPGSRWRAESRLVRHKYLSYSLERYEVTGTGDNPGLVRNGTYPSGVLKVTETENENGNVSREYTDYLGRVLCKETPAGKTHFVYDSHDNLCFVLPPEIEGRNLDAETLDAYAFMYRYDGKNRCIGKKIPGTAWKETVYDISDFPVLTQDGNQRLKEEWTVSIPDVYGRVVLTCIYAGSIDRETVADTRIIAKYDGTGEYGYSVLGIDQACLSVKEVRYYDNYHFIKLPKYSGCNLILMQCTEEYYLTMPYQSLIDPVISKGLETGLWRSLDDGQSGVVTSMFYDMWGREIQSRNFSLDGISYIDDRWYAFTGEVIRRRESICMNGAAVTDVLDTQYGYDHQGRLLHEQATLNGKCAAILQYDYDEIGRRSRTVGLSGTGDTVYVSSVGHNVRGWETERCVRNESGDVIWQSELRYEQPRLYTQGVTAQWNGNISEWNWGFSSESLYTNAYSYDDASRLIASEIYSGEYNSGIFSETGITYDRNGNILTLARAKGSKSENEYLNYNYSGNQLKEVSHQRTDEVSNGICSYDLNGNMTHDGFHNLDLEYTRNNLLKKVISSDGKSAEYSYLSDGSRHSVTWDSGGFLYIGSLIYSMTPDFGGESDEGAELESAIFGGGRIFATQDASGRSCSAVFHICDHLGSVRATVDDGGNILERNSYYAYGRRHEDGSIRDAGNRWRYSGKEEQYSFGVPYIDYGARMYDSELGRWFSPDPMSERYYSVSPYVYCGDNPILMTDSGGEFPLVANIVGAVAGAAVEYVSQVVYNVIDGNLSLTAFTKDIDVLDIGLAAAEGFLTSGTSIVRRTAAKVAVSVGTEALSNALDMNTGSNGTLQVNEVGDIVGATVIGVAAGSVSLGHKTIHVKSKTTRTKAIDAARQSAHSKGKSFTKEDAKKVARKTDKRNEQIDNLNQVVTNQFNTVLFVSQGNILNSYFTDDKKN